MKTRTRVVARTYMVLHSLAGIAMIYPIATGDLAGICIVFALTSWLLAAVWGGVFRRNASSWWALVCLYSVSTCAIAIALLQNWFLEPRALFEVCGTLVALTGLSILAAPLGSGMALYFTALLVLHCLPALALVADPPSGWRRPEPQATSRANEKR